MYKSFTIRNFRGFDELELNNLARVNLIAGKNNVGKTALLEALNMFFRSHNNTFNNDFNPLRGVTQAELSSQRYTRLPWNMLFNWSDTSKDVVLIGENNGQHVLTLKSVLDPNEIGALNNSVTGNTERDKQIVAFDTQGNSQLLGKSPKPFPIALIPVSTGSDPEANATRFTSLQYRGMLDLLLKTLQVFEPRLKQIMLSFINGKPVVSGEFESKQILPFALMGDGLNRIANFVMAVVDSQDGVVLIDEVENGIHYSTLKEMWRAIDLATSEFNVQIFATTHSWECIVAAHQAFSESDSYDFRLHRLDRTKEGKITATTYDQETLEASIEIGMEVR